MNLCNILQANSTMMPPMFNDNQTWLEIKKWLDDTLKLNDIVQSRAFKIVTGVIIVLTFVNCLLHLITKLKVFAIIDNIIILLFFFEVILKFLGLGPQNYFYNKWNFLDMVLIFLILTLDLMPSDIIPHNSDILSKMARMFRITTLIKALVGKSNNQIYIKIRRLMGQTAIILPIIIKFMPLLLITYYMYGIIGMQAFYGSTNITPQQSRYSFYNKFSNFNSFLSTQFIMVQILVEAGWSSIAYDHAFRYGYYALVMIYFVSIHIATVLIISSLIKGLVWQVYSTIDSQFQNRQAIQQQKLRRQAEINIRREQFQQVKRMIDQSQQFLPDTLVKKYIYENKQDLQIMKKIKMINKRDKIKDFRGRKVILQYVKEEHKQFHMQQGQKSRKMQQKLQKQQRQQKIHQISIDKKSVLDLSNDSSIEDFQDSFQLQQKMEEVISKTILNSKIKFFYAIIYSKPFIQFLQNRLVDPFQMVSSEKFNIDRDIIRNKQSVALLSYELNVLLQIQQSQKEQKNEILQDMIEDKILTRQEAAKLANKRKNNIGKNIEVNWVIKKTFLGQTNQALIKKFEVQYFSDIYGRSFKEINKVTIQPLLKYQATLTYCLRNLLRYPTINLVDFFTILTTIQDSFSNKLLKKGSLLKFVYQIDIQSDTWFSIEVKHNRQLKIHFIKSGIWLYTKNQKANKIMYGRDIFNWDLSSRKDHKDCEQLMRKFYESFESLAFCLDNQKIFLSSNPSFYIYDLFSFFIDVSNPKKKQVQPLSISKIMLVVLSKQQEREVANYLSYEFKPLLIGNSKAQSSQNFEFDESENETIKKLKKFEVMDYQKIIQTEGLPYAFLLNLMRDIKDILELYSSTLTKQIENALNIQYEKDELQIDSPYSKITRNQKKIQKSQGISQYQSAKSEENPDKQKNYRQKQSSSRTIHGEEI